MIVVTMKLVFSILGLVLAATVAEAQCNATGIDYTDGGQYVVDASSTKNFSFATVFSGVYIRFWICADGDEN